MLKKEGKLLVSQPIKGTRSRSVDPSMDKANYDDLADSEKDQAENLMIVDLVRNDLNRIAKKGSVSVRDLFTIQAFETVYQMVSTVQAELDAKYTATEVLKSAFPMGSMTGAPKVEVMKWIDKLENYKRGIYSGAIGYIDTNENFDFNVVIRTAILKNGLIYYATGGAITSDSNPQSEWHETVVKSAALEAIFKNK
jgi:para-aminobenzoate synthetase component 1